MEQATGTTAHHVTTAGPVAAEADMVLWLNGDRARDARRAGNKAARLADLTQLGFAVPDGFALDANWCEENGSDVEAVLAAVKPALRRLGGERYAVRSSGLAEDGYEEALAGRYRTELDVSADNVGQAVVRCVRAARETDEREGREHEPVAILVQQMVDAECAGVAFSKDPVTGDDVAVVTATVGLADRLVEGLEHGETWRVDGDQITGEDRVLDASRVREIADLLDRISETFEGPQDVEWAWSDRLFVVQARPITALPVPPPDEPLPAGTWVKDETHYPNGLTPLAGSVYANALEVAMHHAFGRWGLMVEGVKQIVHKHEAYGQPVPAGGGGDGPPPPAWLLGALIRIIPPMRRLVKQAKTALESGLAEELVRRWREVDRERLETELEDLRGVDFGAMSDTELEAHFERGTQMMVEAQKIHFMLFIPYVTALHDLAMFTEAELGWDVHQTLELLAGLSEETSGPARALRELAGQARHKRLVRAALVDPDIPAHELGERLAECDAAFAGQWDAFVERWGHRTMGYDLGEPTLAERPGVIRRRLLEMVEQDDKRIEQLQQRREDAELAAREALSPSHVERFDALLSAARELWPIREENVAYTDSMPNAAVRYAALEVGRRLTRRGDLDRPEDVAMLTREELFDALHEQHDVRDLTRRRHAERAWVAAHPGPRVLGGEEHPMPDLRYVPEPVKRTTGALMWMMDFEFAAAHEDDGSGEIRGVPGAPGRTTGTVRIVNGPQDFHRVRAGDVMVCPTTTPAWTIVFGTLAGIVAEGGGPLAHAAIAAREHHLPAVLGVANARQRLEDGAVVEIDGTRGTVRVVE